MFDGVRYRFLLLAVCCFAIPAVAQSALSQNSGINSTDTWVTLDLTTQTQNATMTLPSAVYDPVTQTTSNVTSVTPPSRTYHVEVGYDSSGGLVMNLWPNGTPVVPDTTDASAISFIRFAGGQITIFDQSGNPIPVAMPDARIPTNWPFNLLGSNPGPSILSSLVVPNIQTRATALHAALTLGSTSATASLAVPMSKGGTTAWTYAQAGTNWVAQQVTVPVSTASLTANRMMQFANVNWNDNSAKDAARAAIASTVQPPPAPTANTPGTLPAPPADPAWTPGPSVISASGCSNTNVYSLGGSQNIALVHGIWSSGCTWTRMANWLNQDFLIAHEIIPSLSSNSALDSSQGTALVKEIQTVGGSNYILIGHSQGGLVSRYAAQYFQNNPPNLTKGVVTVDTPHLGANLTLNSPLVVSLLMSNEGWNIWDNEGCVTPYDNMGCFLAALLVSSGVAIEPTLAAGVGSLSWSQLQPGSAFLTKLNAQPEKFKQAAIVGKTDQRFAFVRTAADFFFKCNPEDGLCGERAIAADAKWAYNYALTGFFLSEFWADYYCAVGNGSYCEYYLELTESLAAWLSGIETADAIYNNFINIPGDGTSDAIVQGPSQYYPYATAVQYPIHSADSHTGATKSNYVRSALDAALKNLQFNVPTQASCAFSVSNSPDSVSGNANTGSFTVSTGTGCQWSTVAQVPWLSITSGVNGTSTGTVGFSIAANPSTVPRQGAIQAGSGSATALFTVSQGGYCGYTLSEGPEVAVPAAGTSNTVKVTTTLSCPWSAVSNTSWITISSGAGGTGSGSFTWTVAPNTSSSSRSGTISVMNQTLTVLDGSPVGTPGTTTVNIQGGPGSYTFYPCPTYCSWVTVPEYGTVTVAVGGQGFGASYGPGVTGNMIAATLASEMNYPLSPISATVTSGTAITIKSTINGAATNYMLSTSSTFNPSCTTAYGGATYCFTSPAFTAWAYGSQLTGGTD